MAKILVPQDIGKYKALVFDFDGVIVASNLIKRSLFFEIWGELRDDSIIEEVLSLGGNRFEIIHALYDKLVFDGAREKKSPKEYIDAYTKLSEIRISELKVNPLIKELLVKHSTDKLLFINSATPIETLKRVIKNLKIDKYFTQILGVEKSKKANFISVNKKYMIGFEEMLYFGDMQSDKSVAEELSINFVPIYSLGSDLKFS